MIHRVVPGLMIAIVAAVPASAQMAIEHRAVGCIVAGQYPKMNACFRPASRLAKARVYFRPEATPTWYYVEMTSDSPCHSGVLPRPSKQLVGQKVEYYVEAQDRAFSAGRTTEYGPVVVESASECRKDLPVAPISAVGPGAVLPGVPAGFVSTGAVSLTTGAIAVAGAGAAGVGAALAIGGDGGNTTTTSVLASGPAPLPPTTATTTTTSTTPPSSGQNRPPNTDFRVRPDPPTGRSPLTVTFNMCRSTDPDNDRLFFKFNFGDGSRAMPYGDTCSFDHVYQATSVRPGAVAPSQVFTSEMCLTDNHFERCHTEAVDVTPAATRCSIDSQGPSVQVTRPLNGGQYGSFSTVPGEATATDSSGVQTVDFVLFKDTSSYCNGAGPYVQIDSKAGTGGPTYAATLNAGGPTNCDSSFPPFGQFFKLKAGATDTCGNVAFSEVQFLRSFYGYGTPIRGAQRRLTIASDLEVEEARGQVVINGTSAFLPGTGRAFTVANTAAGENRVEAMLVDASGRPGLWRFELMSTELLVPGSLRVVAGDVALVTDTAIAFRLRGQPGERVVFSFERR